MTTRLVDIAATDSYGETRVSWDNSGGVGLLVKNQSGDEVYARLTPKQASELAKWLIYAADKAASWA